MPSLTFPSEPPTHKLLIRNLLGRKFFDPDLQQELQRLPYSVVRSHDSPLVSVLIGGIPHLYPPEEITAQLLQHLKNIAECHTFTKVTHAVITVPAHFNDAQRQAIKDAALIAGLTALRLVSEPTAAGIGLRLDTAQKASKSNAEKWESGDYAADMGDGNGSESSMGIACSDSDYCYVSINIWERGVDVSLVEIDCGVYRILRNYTSNHGSLEFDHAMLDYVLEQTNGFNHTDVWNNPERMRKLEMAVVKSEEVLVGEEEATIETLTEEAKNGHFMTVTREEMQEFRRKAFQRTLKMVERVLEETKVGKSDIDGIVLTGNRSHIAQVQPILEYYFDGNKVLSNFNPDRLVVRGAAKMANILTGEYNGWGCPSRRSPMMDMMDVLALSIGIETAGGVFTKLIQRNTVVPTQKSRIFSTVTDSQPTVVLNIYEGERGMVANNKLLGTIELELITRKKGIVNVEVLFEVDAEYKLTVLMEEKESGVVKKVVVGEVTGGAEFWWGQEEEIEQVIREAEEFYEEDMKARERAQENFREVESRYRSFELDGIRCIE